MIKRLLQSAQNSQKHIYGSLNNKNLFYFASKKDLYDILGVSRNSTPDEIKKAYFIKAKKFHPDVNKESDAKEKFAEINNAYETLGDDKKKKVYDQTGFSGDDQMNQGFGEGGFDPFGGFGDFFKQGRGQSKTMEEEFFADFNEFFGDIGKQQTRQTKGSDIFVQIDLEFMEAVNGTKKVIQVEKKGLCTMCQGSKCKPGSAPSKCASCAGKGFMNYRQGPMTVQMVCSKCRGQGISIKNPCPQCQAQGIHMSKFQEEIQIPRGINHGQNIRMTGKGNYNDIGESPGDLILKVNLNQDKYFKRDNYDIYTKIYITISQAVLGHNISIKTLDGEKEIHLQGGTQNGQQIKLEGKGISKLAPNQHQRGDHFVIVEVIIPKQLSLEQQALFQQLKLNEQKIDHFYQRIYLLQKAENKSQTQGQDKNNVFNKFKDFWK